MGHDGHPYILQRVVAMTYFFRLTHCPGFIVKKMNEKMIIILYKIYNIFFIGFWNIAENKLCGKHKFMRFTRLVQQDMLYR